MTRRNGPSPARTASNGNALGCQLSQRLQKDQSALFAPPIDQRKPAADRVGDGHRVGPEEGRIQPAVDDLDLTPIALGLAQR